MNSAAAIQILIIVVGGLITFILIGFIKWTFNYRRKHEKTIEIQGIKIDCIVEGLCSINHGMGDEFKEAYFRNYNQKVSDKKYLEKE